MARINKMWYKLKVNINCFHIESIFFREASLSIEKYNQNYNLQYSFYAKYKTVFAILPTCGRIYDL